MPLRCFDPSVNRGVLAFDLSPEQWRIEEAFGWAKTIGGLRKLKHRGLPKVDFQFTLTFAVYNLVRLCTLGVGT